MKSIRNIAFGALLAIGAFSVVTYTSCTKDECKDVVCQNNGTCVSGTCNCPTGYEGTTCQTKSRDKFIGTWAGADVCNSGTYNVTLSVASSSNEVNALVNNPGGFGNAITITGVVSSANELTFTNQSAGGSGRLINGKMSISGNALTFEYTVTATIGADDACKGTYAKQ